MKKVAGYLIVFLFLFSCKEERNQEPEKLIEKKEMLNILYDLSIVYAAKGINPGIEEINKLELESFIYEKYGIDSLQFANSTLYYSSQPSEYLKMYEQIQERLKARKDSIVKEREAKKPDSTRVVLDTLNKK
ncbi:DUF4296 domain-containing protein [Ascidiimonas aurantiaca]|uniref:DUF4296 domain-containing protein n=1 Tax=Ascidiimonas aurantiaca TaxID=1685432 RepID=UPI0030ED943C